MDPESTEKPAPPRVARRALLASAAAGLAALGAQAVLPAGAAKAGGTPVILGVTNVTDAPLATGISRPDVSSARLATLTSGVIGVTDNADGAGVEGRSFASGGVGVRATGDNGTGVFAQGAGSRGIAVRALSTGGSGQIAVLADGSAGNGEGYAVKAQTKNGIALYGSAVGGYALQVDGLAVFSRSGKVTFSTGQASRTITGRSIIASSLVVATIQGYAAGVWVAGVVLNTAAQSFTIKLNKAAPKALQVGWFIVN